MVLRTMSSVLVAAGLLVTTAAFGQQHNESDRSRSAAPQQNAKGGEGDEQLDQLLVQIAQDPKTAADKLFLLTAAMHNRSEIELAKGVMQKTQNPQVKKTAQSMLQRLEKTQNQLERTAQAIGLQIPPELNRAAVQEVQIVAAMPPDQMDRQYMARAQADNANDASQYQSQAQIAEDPQVRQFSQDQAQGVQERTRNANQTARGLGMSGGEEAQPASGNVSGHRANGH